MRGVWTALVVALVLMVPAVAVAQAPQPPSVTSQPSSNDILELLKKAIKDSRIKNGLQEGDSLSVRHGGNSASYTYADGQITTGARKASTIQVNVDKAALVSLVNAYDQTNSAKLAIKGKYITVTSSRASVQTAVSGLQKTGAADDALGVAPKVGDNVNYKGCSGTLTAADARSAGKPIVALCGSDYAVDALGGITTKLAPKHLQPNNTVSERMGINSAALSSGSTGTQPPAKSCGIRPTIPTPPPTGSRSPVWNTYFSEVKTYQRNLLAYSLCIAQVDS